jgi:hypothetical protein
MKSTCSILFLLLAALLLGVPLAGAQQPWERTLQGGGQVHVDPRTGKAQITTSRGATGMLWDGVHKLEDGTTMIVRDGVVVPDRAMVQARRAPARAPEAGTLSPCVILERQSCGLYGECAQTVSCGLARQLLSFEKGDSGNGHQALLWSQARCQDALSQPDTFKPCKRCAEQKHPTPCTELAASVCGDGRCAESTACQAARQLVDMEYEERLRAVNPEVLTETGRQCREAKRAGGFFAACPTAPASE